MLLSLTITAFKAYEEERITLEPFNVLVGRNGSGKTSVLQALEFLHGIVVSSFGDHLGSHSWNYWDLPRLRSESRGFSFGALLELDGALYWWHVALGKRKHEGIERETVIEIDHVHRDEVLGGAIVEERHGRVVMSRSGRTMRRFDVAGSAEEVTQTLTSSWLSTVTPDDVDRYPGLLAIAEWARRIQPYVVLDPNRLREPSKVTDRGIGAAGDSLAGFLRYLQRDRPDSFERVHARVEEAYDRLEAVNLDVEDGSLYSLEVQERWTDDNPFLNVRQASDGLLRLFAFAAMPEVEPPPTLLMIDELENGVHPQLLGALVDLLQELSNHSIQIVATSHSPVVLNWVDDHSGVLLTSRDASGCAHVTPLDSTPGYDYFRSAYDAGEMWLAAGEQGLIDGPAATR